jgi:hypothetical protein
VDKDFAVELLSHLVITSSPRPQPKNRCCLACDRLILSSTHYQARGTSGLRDCILCEFLISISTGHDQEASADATIERHGSYLFLGDGKVLTIRRGTGERQALSALVTAMTVT